MQNVYDVVNFNDWIDSMNTAATAGHSAGTGFRDFSIALKKIKDNMESEYKRYVGRLPGSTRTRRLKKKRDKMISDWFANFEEK